MKTSSGVLPAKQREPLPSLPGRTKRFFPAGGLKFLPDRQDAGKKKEGALYRQRQKTL
jgi:hypothetical protein